MKASKGNKIRCFGIACSDGAALVSAMKDSDHSDSSKDSLNQETRILMNEARYLYRIDQSIQVEINGTNLENPWAGGINASQLNMMDLNEDGALDLVLFDKTAIRISTFLFKEDTYQYAPQYEILFPNELNTFFVLRDYNCDGKKDIFTFGQIGIFVFQNITQPGKPLTWKKMNFYNSSTGLSSDVLLTKGFSGKINLLPGSNDLPNFSDMDGDGDLDVLNMRFVSPGTAEYHRNFSMERYGRCDSFDLERQTSTWGNFLECGCGLIAFNGQTCADIGGREIGARTQHTGGKALLILDSDNDGDKDLLFAEESCQNIYFMENQGNATNPVLGGLALYPPPPNLHVSISLFPAPYLEDVDHDGKLDLLVSPNLYTRTGLSNNFRESLWFYKNEGSNQVPNFVFKKPNYLQDDMIEVGDFSAPALTDIDLDGDNDLFVGNYADPNSLRGSISQFQNTGTPSAPSFKLITSDFAKLSLYPFNNIKPQFIDIDKNGSADLAFTASTTNGTKFDYILSQSSTAPSFLGQPLGSFGVTLALNETATLVDVNQDDHLDILIGKSTGALQYWRNSGTGSFSLSSDAYLGIGISPTRQYPTVATGDLNGDHLEDLLLGENSGKLSVYSDFRSAGNNPQPITGLIYDSFSETYSSKNLGGSTKAAITTMMGEDKPEIVVGNRLGGLHVLRNDNGIPTSDIPVVKISPNPVVSGESLYILADRGVMMELFTTMGVRVGTPMAIPAHQTTAYPLQGIASGLYIARFSASSKAVAHRFIIH